MSLLKVNEIQIFNGETVTITAPAVVTANDNTNAALRITQTGTGNALVVEDDTNPDSTPFVVGGGGQVIRGHTATISLVNPDTGTANGPQLEVVATSIAGASIGSVLHVNNAGQSGYFALAKSRGVTVGDMTSLASGDTIGFLSWQGSDGASFVRAADIKAQVDGPPGTNDMPGRLVFSTTADGAASPTERMRIDSAGNVGIGTTSPNSRLNVVTSSTDAAVTITQTGTGNALVVEDSANPDSTPFVVNSAGRVGIGVTTVARGPLHVHEVGANASQVHLTNDTTGASASDGTTFYNNGSDAGVWHRENGNFLIATNNTERMRIDSSGNVGIGTTSPSQKLDVSGNINATGALTLGTALAITEGGTGATDAATARTNLGLGSAATTASTDYATAAQGTLADSAVQPGDDANTLGSGAATDGYVLTADGAGGAAWEAVSGGGGGTTAYVEHSSTISDSFTIASGTNRMYIGGTTFSGTISVAGRLAIVAGPANFTGTINITGTLATV